MLKKITVEKIILFLAAGFAAYNFGLAGGYIEGTKFSIGGLVAGLVVNVSLAIAASRYGSLNGAKRTKQAQVAFVTMLVLSPILVSPVVFYSLPDAFLSVWWLRALWSVAWPLVADLAIVLAGAVSGRGLIALSEQSATQSPKSAIAGATHSAKVQLQSAKSATESGAVQRTYPRKCEHCKEIIRTPQAVGAHMKKHHPEMCKPKPMAVGLFERAVEKAEKPA